MSFTFLSGPAGTGKTHNLIDEIRGWIDWNGLGQNQQVLCLTFMHSSRRRLEERLKYNDLSEFCKVMTIDSHSLSIVNRWHSAIGLSHQVIPKDEHSPEFTPILGEYITYEEILALSIKLLASQVVLNELRLAFPLIAIDEAQDCTGTRLQFVRSLCSNRNVIAAADPFQALDGCEDAIEWLHNSQTAHWHLNDSFRTESTDILSAANALRQRTIVSSPLLKIAGKYQMAAWAAAYPKKNGSCALIAPTKKGLKRILGAIETQHVKKPNAPFPQWHEEGTNDERVALMRKHADEYIARSVDSRSSAIKRLSSKLDYLQRSINGISNSEIIEQWLGSEQTFRNYSAHSNPRFSAMTVHAAKNREFEHVVVLWDPNTVSAFSEESQRRLLYNAITRSKTSCMVVAIGSATDIRNNPILSLLGDGAPLFPTKHKPVRKTRFASAQKPRSKRDDLQQS
jgi:superfamily I DNA/RNA helicase